ncbi:hypothetical protein QE422_001748 [Chryseobacterium sp. SORGH_AS 447]|nr:hypothetical protein [Chryseobacterium sp. SORGH_AS_0447]
MRDDDDLTKSFRLSELNIYSIIIIKYNKKAVSTIG